MRVGYVFLPLVALALASSACGKKPPVATPAPNTGGAPTTGANPGGRATTPNDPAGRGGTDPAEARKAELLRILQEEIHFDFDQDAIRSGDGAILDRKAAVLVANPAVRLRISGHADERGSDEYNLVLGNKRAASAKRYLESKGVDGARVDIISFGEERPVDSASSEEAWARNRRAGFEILAGADRLVSPQ